MRSAFNGLMGNDYVLVRAVDADVARPATPYGLTIRRPKKSGSPWRIYLATADSPAADTFATRAQAVAEMDRRNAVLREETAARRQGRPVGMSEEEFFRRYRAALAADPNLRAAQDKFERVRKFLRDAGAAFKPTPHDSPLIQGSWLYLNKIQRTLKRLREKHGL